MKFIKYILVFLFLISNIDVSGSQSKKISIPNAKNGIFDLRNTSLDEKIALNGEWYFYWNQLLSPGKESFKNRTIVDFPMAWNKHEQIGKKLPAIGFASYSLTVLLPKTDKPQSIAIPPMYSAYRLFINGEQVAENGKVSVDKKDFVPYWENKTVDLRAGVDTLNIVLQISNFTYAIGGINKPILIGPTITIDKDRIQIIASELFVAGCVFLGGLFLLGLYFLGNKDKATLLFSLYCLVFTYRVLGSGEYTLHTIFPGLNWYYTLRLENLILIASIWLFSIYPYYLFKEEVKLFFYKTITFTCLILFVLALFLDTAILLFLVIPIIIVLTISTTYIIYVFYKAFKNDRPGSIYALFSSILLVAIPISVVIYSYYFKEPYPPTLRFLHLIFFLLQSLILSKQLSFTLNIARFEAEQGLKVKGEFLNTISHEIRTPLNSVIGLSHLLLKKNPRPDQIEKLNVMLFSANNLLYIVNDILDYNKIEAGKLNFENIEIDIQLISKKIIKQVNKSATDKGIDLKLTIDKTIKNKFLGDSQRIAQVLSNLIYNGIKFTNEGSVELILYVVEQSEKTITIEFRVKDTGIGISEEKQKLIFEQFTQADSSTSRLYGGTGLGLAISKRILELQNTTLNLESKVGQGSEFYFTQTFEKCIIHSKTTVSNSIIISEENRQLAGLRFLLVEDNAMNIMVAKKTLENWGAFVDVATNGLEALEMVDPSLHSLVLMDLNMPVMDGYDASKKMRDQNITLPIIALTASLPKEVEEKVRKSGINEIVVKPFLPDELYRIILNYINSK